MFKNFFFSALAVAATFFTANAHVAVNSKLETQNSKLALTPTILRAGTSVFLQLNEQFDATEISVGNALEFTVRRDVTVNGRVVIAAGSPATGIVRKVEKGCKGKCSKITIAVESAQAVDGQTVNLNSIPHVIEAPCCDGEAEANIGANLTTNVRNDIRINA